MFGKNDALAVSSRDFIFSNATAEEQLSFIEIQISNPFDSGSNNYFKKIRNNTSNQNDLDEICVKLFSCIEDTYPDIEFEVSDHDDRLASLFSASYKFFIKNISKMMYIFIKEYIYCNKNRKYLIEEFINDKTAESYPKEQYGKKEYFVLMTRLGAIIKLIFDDGITLSEFANTIDMSDGSPIYIADVIDGIERGYILDHSAMKCIYEKFANSNMYNRIINKLEMDITETFIIPYLVENNMMDVRRPVIEMDTDDDDDDDESEE